MNEHRKIHLFFPLVFITLGVFLLLSNLGRLEGSFGELLGTYWPLILVFIGIDGLINREGWVAALVFLGLGSILVLGNMKILEMDTWMLISRLWPVLLVAIGLDIAFGRRGGVWVGIARVVVGLALIGGILWFAISSPLNLNMRSLTLEQPLSGSTSAEVHLDMLSGKVALDGMADDNLLASGTLEYKEGYSPKIEFIEPKDGHSKLYIWRTGSTDVYFGSPRTIWTVHLNSQPVYQIIMKAAVGEIRANLENLAVDHLDLDMAVGNIHLTLPADTALRANIDGAIGSVTVWVPKGTSLIVRNNTALATISVPQGYGKNKLLITSPDYSSSSSKTIELTIQQAIGTVTIKELP